MLLLGSSPLAFVYLAAVVRRGLAEEEERVSAVHSGKPSQPAATGRDQASKIFIVV